jgi:predicted ester cyclase
MTRASGPGVALARTVVNPDLVPLYRGYLAALNERRFDDLAGFVAGEVRYNGERQTLADYQAARRAEAEAIPDLRFRPTRLVADRSGVAAVLDFRCTPTGRFAGLDFSGRTIRFTEHVFYGFEDGLITEVVSLLDRPAIERQADPR